MKRAILVGTGTVAGVAAILALNPNPAVQTASGGKAAGSAPASTGTSRSSTSGTSSTKPGSGSQDGTFTGSAVDVGNGYGTVQVEVKVTGGRLVDVTALEVPQNDPRSQQISSVAIPYLVQQALQAQSAQIAGVSGASYTSSGFAQSLASALQQAGM